MEENQKISFINRFIISIKDFEKYKIFALEKVRKSIKYVVQFTLIFVIFIALVFSIKYGMIINNTLKYINTDLPNFSYKDGNLDFENTEPIELQNEEDVRNISYKTIIDTKTEDENQINDYKNKVSLYNYGIIILKNKLIIKNSNSSQTIERTYSDLVNNYGIAEEFNKQDLTNFLNSKNKYILFFEMFGAMYLYMFITYFITILVDALFLGVLGFITARIVRVKIKYASAYSIALHSLTLPIILNVIYIAVNTFTGFYVKYFDIMYTAISYIYVVAAILSIRADLIKQQVELQKIKDESKQFDENVEDNSDKENKDEEEKEDSEIEIDIDNDEEEQEQDSEKREPEANNEA